jgi:hypothetical protein
MQGGLSFRAIKYDKKAFFSIKKKVLLQYSKIFLMAYQHYRLTAFLYAVLLFISAPVCYSQQNSFDKLGNLFSLVKNKVDSSLENDFVLMNARYFIDKYPRAYGKPYFDVSNYSPCKLILGNNTYKDIHLIYDIFEQKLHFGLNKSNEKGIVFELNNQVITGFYLDDKVFVNYYELPFLPQSGFYEEIFLGKHLNVYARWSKDYVETITLQNIGEFTSQKRKLLFEINGKMVDISSKKKFLKIFAGERNKIKSFMKENKIRLFKSNNSDLTKLFSYTDSFL